MKKDLGRVNGGLARDFRNTVNEALGSIENNFKEAEQRIDNVVVNASTGEIQANDARLNAKGEIKTTLKKRLDDDYSEMSAKINLVESNQVGKPDLIKLQTQLDNLVVSSGDETASNAEIQQAKGIYTTLNGKINEQFLNVLKSREDLYGDVKGPLNIGYYSSSDGSYNKGVNWYNFLITSGSHKDYVLESTIPVSLRMLEFDSSGALKQARTITNGPFTLNTGTTKFIINVKITDAIPTSEHTVFNNVAELYPIIVRKGEGIKQKVEVLERDVSNNVMQIPVVNTEVQTKLNTTLRPGFYSYTTGQLTGSDGSTNWFHYYVTTVTEKKYLVKNNISGSMRLVEFKGGAVHNWSVIKTNEPFVILDTTTSFSINIETPNANPHAFNPFPNLDSFELFYYVLEKELKSISKIVTENIGVENTAVEKEQVLSLSANQGFYSRDTGEFKTTGTNWYSYTVNSTTDKKFILKHAVEGAKLRLCQFNNNVFLGASYVYTNEPFRVSESCTHFGINIPVATPDPLAPDVTYFVNTSGFTLSKYTTQYKPTTLLSRIKLLEEGSIGREVIKSLKILMIGNSFSQDACEWLYDIAKNAGITLSVGVLYRGGESLQGHWGQIQNNANSYTYYKWDEKGRNVARQNTSLDYAVVDEPWDYITLQQASEFSGMSETYQPYLNNIITHVDSIKTNSLSKYGFHMTWAYAETSTHPGFTNYNKNQMTMYDAIVSSYQKAMSDTNIDVLIPSGTAIQNARTNPYLKAVGNDLTRDGHHLDYGTGRYIAALTVFQVLLSSKFQKDLFEHVDFVPGNGGNKFLSYMAKTATKNACLNPFNVTKI